MVEKGLVEECFVEKRLNKCWAVDLDDEVVIKDYTCKGLVEGLENLIKETGKNPIWTTVSEKLLAYGVDRDPKSIANHFRGLCGCQR